MTIFLPSLSSLFLSLYSSVSTYYINSIDSQRNEIKMLVTFLKCATIHTVVVAAALSPKNPNKIISRENHVKCLKFFLIQCQSEEFFLVFLSFSRLWVIWWVFFYVCAYSFALYNEHIYHWALMCIVIILYSKREHRIMSQKNKWERWECW